MRENLVFAERHAQNFILLQSCQNIFLAQNQVQNDPKVVLLINVTSKFVSNHVKAAEGNLRLTDVQK